MLIESENRKDDKMGNCDMRPEVKIGPEGIHFYDTFKSNEICAIERHVYKDDISHYPRYYLEKSAHGRYFTTRNAINQSNLNDFFMVSFRETLLLIISMVGLI